MIYFGLDSGRIERNMSINKHFKRETKLMLGIALFPIVSGILLSFIIPKILAHKEIDSCLDSGGSYNYETCSCDHENNHEVKKDHKCN
jgi:hypothetical protein